jgi:hypothetical protein
MLLVQKILATRLFQRTESLSTYPKIIWWWECRRIPFNLIIGLLGIVTCVCLLAMEGISEKYQKQFYPSGGGGSPIFFVIMPILYGITANVCYTGGWILEIVAKKLWQERAANFGEISFALGFAFSIVLTLVPIAVGLLFLLLALLFH